MNIQYTFRHHPCTRRRYERSWARTLNTISSLQSHICGHSTKKKFMCLRDKLTGGNHIDGPSSQFKMKEEFGGKLKCDGFQFPSFYVIILPRSGYLVRHFVVPRTCLPRGWNLVRFPRVLMMADRRRRENPPFSCWSTRGKRQIKLRCRAWIWYSYSFEIWGWVCHTWTAIQWTQLRKQTSLLEISWKNTSRMDSLTMLCIPNIAFPLHKM